MTSQTEYTIKEVSRLSGLPASTLRYYEGIGLIRPIKRDESSKQRVYSQDDVNMIDSLACLSATGLSLDDMRNYIDNLAKGIEGARNEIELLRSQAIRLEAESQYLELRKRYVALKIDYWKAVELNDNIEVERITIEARKLSALLKLPKE
jgi:DNA-binding transcriptional MerR regulator